MLNRLHLIRHGLTDWNARGKAQGHADIPLNDEGRAQAHRLAARMEGTPLRALYSSDLGRAAETARILGARIGLEPVFDPAWREVDVGDYEGGTGAPLGSFMAWIAAGHDEHGGETYEEVAARVADGYARIGAQHRGESVAIVSHGGVLKALVVHLLGLGPDKVGHFSFAGNTGVTTFDFHTGNPRLTLLNDASHL